MTQGVRAADMVQKRLLRTFRTGPAGPTNRRLYTQPVLVLIERADSRQYQVDRCVRTLTTASSRHVADPAHELRQLWEPQNFPGVLRLNQKGPEGLKMVGIRPHRIWRSPKPVKVDQVFKAALAIRSPPTGQDFSQNSDPSQIPGTHPSCRSSPHLRKLCVLRRSASIEEGAPSRPRVFRK